MLKPYATHQNQPLSYIEHFHKTRKLFVAKVTQGVGSQLKYLREAGELFGEMPDSIDDLSAQFSFSQLRGDLFWQIREFVMSIGIGTIWGDIVNLRKKNPRR